MLATWALLLDMLFGDRIAHLGGINSIGRHLMSLANTKHCYSTEYFANVVWFCMDNAVRHFNKVIPYGDLRVPTFQAEWAMHAQKWQGISGLLPSVVTYSSGTGPGDGSGASLTSSLSSNTVQGYTHFGPVLSTVASRIHAAISQ